MAADGETEEFIATVILTALGFYFFVQWFRQQTATDQGGATFPGSAPTGLEGGAVGQALELLVPLQLSAAGEGFIKQQEGWTPVAKSEPKGGRVIGWGHDILPGENFPGAISKAKGQELFNSDVGKAESAINGAVTVALSQDQFDALVDFVFNEGANAFEGSTMLRRLNAGDYAGAAQEFERWDLAGGRVSQDLVNRRAAEQQLFNGGTS